MGNRGKGRGDEDAISPMHKCVLDAGSLLMASRGLLFVILKGGVGIGLDSRGQLAWGNAKTRGYVCECLAPHSKIRSKFSSQNHILVRIP